MTLANDISSTAQRVCRLSKPTILNLVSQQPNARFKYVVSTQTKRDDGYQVLAAPIGRWRHEYDSRTARFFASAPTQNVEGVLLICSQEWSNASKFHKVKLTTEAHPWQKFDLISCRHKLLHLILRRAPEFLLAYTYFTWKMVRVEKWGSKNGTKWLFLPCMAYHRPSQHSPAQKLPPAAQRECSREGCRRREDTAPSKSSWNRRQKRNCLP